MPTEWGGAFRHNRHGADIQGVVDGMIAVAVEIEVVYGVGWQWVWLMVQG